MIRKDDILKATDKGIHVFRHYLGKDFKVGKNFLNPFYRDTKASCNIYYDRKAGVFKMKDFGNEEYSGDCFELVDRLNGLDCRNPKDFVEIMRIIDRDLYLGLSKNDNLKENRPMGTNSENDEPTDVPMERRKRPYTTVQKPFSTLELAFYTLIATEQEPIFGYLGWKHVKAYRFLSQRRFPYGDMREELAHLHKYFICPLADIYLWHIFIPSGTIYYIDLLYILL